jgi:hypothetical protein
VFEDSSGALVMCFDKIRAVGEGDLSTYMQNVVKLGRIAADYRLVKVPSEHILQVVHVLHQVYSLKGTAVYNRLKECIRLPLLEYALGSLF